MAIPGCMGMPFAIIMPGCMLIGAGTMPARHTRDSDASSSCKCPHIIQTFSHRAPQNYLSAAVEACLLAGKMADFWPNWRPHLDFQACSGAAL